MRARHLAGAVCGFSTHTRTRWSARTCIYLFYRRNTPLECCYYSLSNLDSRDLLCWITLNYYYTLDNFSCFREVGLDRNILEIDIVFILDTCRPAGAEAGCLQRFYTPVAPLGLPKRRFWTSSFSQQNRRKYKYYKMTP